MKYDAIVIGGGPAGLTAGIYLVREGVKTLLLEKMVVGGTPLNTEKIENYPGFPEAISGKDLMERFIFQAKNCGLEIKEFQEVKGVERVGNLFSVHTADTEYEAYGLIVATGTSPLKLGIPGEDRYFGRGISYCATCDGPFFKDKTVAVIGGGDSALEEALFLTKIANHVYLIHRRETLRAQKILQDRAFKNPKITFWLNKIPLEIKGGEFVEKIVIEDTKTGERGTISVDGVFIYVGSKPDTTFLGDLVERDENGFVLTDENLFTKTMGILAAGDVRKKMLRQIATAVGDGALAAYNLQRYLLNSKI
ncbi:MAG: thioredoxin-disulfide reductase [Desulfobacterota bacterium]|nr:thioredoxin-disulfide reductase [Thermodesulfobacteriota bacterium]MDW8001118.1 thioredoxin-disulfide reductase [Deltaproteobacteria bacterium]